MDTLSQMQAIQELNFPSGDRDFQDTVCSILQDYGYPEFDKVPEWFKEMIDMICSRRPGFVLFDEVGSDMGSVLLELNDSLGWGINDYGEGVEMSFPISRMRVFISREALSS